MFCFFVFFLLPWAAVATMLVMDVAGGLVVEEVVASS